MEKTILLQLTSQSFKA